MPPPKLSALFHGSAILLPALLLLAFCVRPAHAFGAGNIASLAKIEGQNWRHGDIEDTLLSLVMSASSGKKFGKMDVKRVYFGNWLRDYSQAVDVGTVKYVSAEAIRILLWVLGFLSFGYGTGEFEVTSKRLGCYRPEEHIDNPKDYADNEDARRFDRRLRGPVDERRELSIDERTGLKNYIASEDLGIATSAGLVRDLFRRSIDLGRRSGGRGADFYEALRLLGTACHCLEDYSAHSNYTELALIELGERDVFPHVGRRAQFRVQGARGSVYPIVTGTFGGVDFLHSVMGEFSDKATQSELQELEGAIADADNKKNKSVIKDLLSQLPSGVFGGKDQAGKVDQLEANSQAAAMNNLHITPKEPEALTQQINEIVKQIYPIMEFHDEIMQSISSFVEKIPILPELIENIQDQINIFVFSLLAPFVLPIINQVKTELETGSSEVIQSSLDKQHIVFNDDNCTDPTHSMLSKDHFSNVLNEPAGRIASEVLKWAVPQIVQCWDDQRVDAERTIQRIVTGVFHHPALYQYGDDGASDCRHIMFQTVQNWWGELSDRARDDLRDKLSRDGVEQGRNHKEGVHDKGHGCGKPLGFASDLSGVGGNKSGKGYGNDAFQDVSNQAGRLAGEAVGGGALGGIVGGLVGGIGGTLLGGAFGDDEKKSKKTDNYGEDGSYTETYSESGHHRKKSRDDVDRYGQAEYKHTQYSTGGHREEYSRFEQDSQGGSYGFQQKVELSGYGGSGGYERHEERVYESGNQWQSGERHGDINRHGEYHEQDRKKHSKKDRYDSRSEDEDEDDNDYEKQRKKEQKRHEKEEKHKKHDHHHGRNSDDDFDDRRAETAPRWDAERSKRQSPSPSRRSDGFSHRREEGYRVGENSGYGEERRYGQEESYNIRGQYEHQEQTHGGRREEFGAPQDYEDRRQGSGASREEFGGFRGDGGFGGGQREDGRYGRGEGYQQSNYSGRRDDEDEYGESRQQYGYGGGYGGDRDDEYGERY